MNETTVDHWIAVADTLKQQRDQAEKERDALRKECNEALTIATNRAETEDRWRTAFNVILGEVATLHAERDALRKVTATMEELAREAYAHWDNDADSKVGKCLVALSGATGLRKDLDRARDAVLEATP